MAKKNMTFDQFVKFLKREEKIDVSEGAPTSKCRSIVPADIDNVAKIQKLAENNNMIVSKVNLGRILLQIPVEEQIGSLGFKGNRWNKRKSNT